MKSKWIRIYFPSVHHQILWAKGRQPWEILSKGSRLWKWKNAFLYDPGIICNVDMFHCKNDCLRDSTKLIRLLLLLNGNGSIPTRRIFQKQIFQIRSWDRIHQINYSRTPTSNFVSPSKNNCLQTWYWGWACHVASIFTRKKPVALPPKKDNTKERCSLITSWSDWNEKDTNPLSKNTPDFFFSSKKKPPQIFPTWPTVSFYRKKTGSTRVTIEPHL